MDELMRQFYADMYGINNQSETIPLDKINSINEDEFSGFTLDPNTSNQSYKRVPIEGGYVLPNVSKIYPGSLTGEDVIFPVELMTEMQPLDSKASDPNQGPSSLVPSKYNLMPVYDPADQLVYDQYGEMGPPIPPVMFDNMTPMFGESGVEEDYKLPKPQNLDDVQQKLANAQVLNKDAQSGLLDNLNKETEDLPNISKANVTPKPDIPKQTKPSDSLLTAAKNQIKKGKLDKPELYYAMSMGQNLGATISNMLQDSPPVMSLQKNYLKRQKMDPTIYRNIMEDIKEGVAMQTRKLREGAGQMSDYIKGTAATGVGLNRAIQKLGESARQDLAKTTAMNTQIANQELSGLSETLNKEKLFNYQQKQQFAAQKQAALSNNMSNMNKIMRGYADYQYKKDKMNKQQEYMKDYVQRQDRMNAIKTALDYQQQIKQSPAYAAGLLQYEKESIKNYDADFLNKYGKNYQQIKDEFTSLDNIDGEPGEIQKLNTEFNTATQDYKKAKEELGEGIPDLLDADYEEKQKNYLQKLSDLELQKEELQNLSATYQGGLNKMYNTLADDYGKTYYNFQDTSKLMKELYSTIFEKQDFDKYMD